MKWEGQRQSDNVEDARSSGGAPRSFRLGGRSIGLGTLAVAVVAGMLFGVNPLTILGMLGGGGGGVEGQTQQQPAGASPADDQRARFIATVLADTEDVWAAQFRQAGNTYQPPKLRLFSGSEPTACGRGEAAMGPFYCPGDAKVYIDLDFFEVMQKRLGTPGDFAQAYVIAHEVGHHVQHLIGANERGGGSRARAENVHSVRGDNAHSVRVELQADCFAGVWAHDTQKGKAWLEQGDIEEALNAASRVGDDNIQRRTQGQVVPETFTHGSSAQRVAWFKRGLAAGKPKDCDTFAVAQP